MEDVTIPTTGIPVELKAATEQTLKRANELKKADPVVSYWCCFWAVQKALKVPNRSKEGTGFLMQLLDALEGMKAVLASNEAVTNDAAGAAYMENFALRVFLGADNDDRAGKGNKATVQKFVVATQFIDVLNAFEGGASEEMEQKSKYAKWKAADIAKALREGRTPLAGPPVAEEDEASAFPSLAALTSPGHDSTAFGGSPGSTGSPHKSPNLPPHVTSPSGGSRRSSGNSGIVRPNMPPPLSPPSATPFLPAPPSEPAGVTSPSTTWSTMATPGIADSDEEKETAKHELSIDKALESKDSTPKLPTVPLHRTTSQSSGKSVRFSGPDGEPLSPGGTTSTVSVFDETPAPPPSDIDSFLGTAPPPTAASSAPPVLPPPPPATHRSPPKPSAPPRSPVKPPTAFPSAPPPPATSHLGFTPQPSAPPAPPVIAASGTPRILSIRENDQFKKHCRFAISAMDYDDTETARRELLKALEMLS